MESMEERNKPLCRELEQLAAAAASRSYTTTNLNSTHVTVSESPVITVNMPSHASISHSTNAVSRVISYIDPYDLARGHQFVPIRTYEAQQLSQDHTSSTQLHASRLVMLPVANHAPTHANVIIPNSRSGAHYAVAGIQSQNEQITMLNEENIQATREPCIVHHDNNGTIHYTFSVNAIDSYNKTADVTHIKSETHPSLAASDVNIPMTAISCGNMPVTSISAIPYTSIPSVPTPIHTINSLYSVPATSLHTASAIHAMPSTSINTASTTPLQSLSSESAQSISLASSFQCNSPSLSQTACLGPTQAMLLPIDASNLNIDLPKLTSPAPAEKMDLVKKGVLCGKRKIQKSIALREAENDLHGSDEISRNQTGPCKQCKDQCNSESELSQINCKHNIPKRNGLSLELKIEIIKRITSGEKKADMADEYGVNQSTIKSIMKKSDNYLMCWKKGMFNPGAKRLKHAKREDVEQALTLWYKQSVENAIPISGAILCLKAVDFAEKLGHHDFKATHGWLDRFKKRKKIVFGRGSFKKRREEYTSNDAKVKSLQSTILPKVLNDYDPNNIFTVEHIGLFYHSLPSDVAFLRGKKCPGGIGAKDRLSLVLCTNMTGSEKFPLLVVGRCPKILNGPSPKTLPVHYVVNKNAWFTPEIISSWLLDMDSWFMQQNRKVVMLGPSLTIYSQLPKLKSVNLIVMPSGSPAPLQPLVTSAFKKFYRKRYLEEFMMTFKSEAMAPPSLPLFTCLQFLSSSWQALSESLIVTGFQRTGLTKYGAWGMAMPTENPMLFGAQELMLNVLHALGDISTSVSFEEYVCFDDELQVCNLMSDDDILAKVTSELEGSGGSDLDEDISDNDEGKEPIPTRPPFSKVESAFSVLRKYIQYQDGAHNMFRELSHLENIIYKALSESTCGNSSSNVM